MEPENPGMDGHESNPGNKAGNKPMYLEAAGRLAREGEGVESFLARNVRVLGSSRFPGPDCLHPDELAAFRRTGRLPDGRAAHMAECDACSAMVDATQPSPERIRAFREAVAELRPAPRRQWPVNGWVWAPALAAGIAVVAIIGGSILRPGGSLTAKNPVEVRQAKPTPVTGRSETSDRGVVVTASVSGSKVYRETPSITVTAKPENVDTTAAAAAAVLSHPPNLVFTWLDGPSISQASNSKSANNSSKALARNLEPCGKQTIVYYTNLVNQYAIDSENGAPDVSEWLASYRKTAEKRTGMFDIVYSGNEKGDVAQVTCSPDGVGQNAGKYVASFPIFDTLSAASAYLTEIKKLKSGKIYTISLGPGNEDVSAAQNVSVSVKPATRRVEVLDFDHLTLPGDASDGGAAVAIQGMWSRRATASTDVAK